MAKLSAKKKAALETELAGEVGNYKQFRIDEKELKDKIGTTQGRIVEIIEQDLTPSGETPPKTVVMTDDKVTITRRVLGKNWDQDKLKKTLKAKLYKAVFVERLQIDFRSEKDLQKALKLLKENGLTMASGAVIDAKHDENIFSEERIDQMITDGDVTKSEVEKCYDERLGKASIRVSKAGKEKEEKKLYL